MKVLIADKIHDDGIKILKESGFDVVQNYQIVEEELKEEIEKYTAIIVRSRTKITAEILEHARNLKVIGRAGVGLDNIDLAKAEDLNITVFNTPNAPSVSVAELTLGLLLNLVRHISKADETMHCGNWNKSAYMGTTLKGKKIGLIGFGNIGHEVATRCKAFEMKIGVYDIAPDIIQEARELGYTVFNTIDDLIKESQIISLHLPSTVETENIINERNLRLMDPDDLIINTARGTLIDEKALLNVLEAGEIGGAALDVYREEPLNNMEICNCEENLILTPHIGSQTKETQIQASTMVAKKISNYLKNL
ncbi:MAG: hydroxyacid dehydrogenase [Promethearchaeota archaeon]|jgi:D-3-phosphoglycerate dehydrogenase